MAKPFEPRHVRLFYPADDVVEADVYISDGMMRRFAREGNRVCRKYAKRSYRKQIKMAYRHNVIMRRLYAAMEEHYNSHGVTL